MNYIKHYGKLSLKFLISLFLGSFIISLMYYFFMSSKTVKILSFIYLIVIFFIFNFQEGRQTKAKGYLSGLKTSSLFIFLMLIFNLLFFKNFSWLKIIYYLILVMVGVFSAMLGINTLKK